MHPIRSLVVAALVVASAAWAAAVDGSGAVTISGELKRWHAVTLSLDGPWASETGTPNPFLDRRMDVTFSNGALSYVVPGYFAADGNAGETSATAGTIWRAHLSPDLTGTWTWRISFRAGIDVAASGGGTALAPYDGRTGTFTIAESDKSGRDFRAKGRLQYVGARYLRHKGNGQWFVKAGADSPENMLGYADFDGTYDQGGGALKSWSPHVGDWRAGDPTWKGGKGKGLIGALNYLAGEGCNVFSFLTYNAGGDGKDVWPFIGHADRLRYDCSKLDQWERVFAHADRLGMYLHFKTQETENDDGASALDGGAVARERRLYYRELIARFAHHLALNWNLGEENTQTTEQRQAMAQYFHDNDPYRHPVVLHTYPGQQESVYRPLLGDASKLTGASIQIGWNTVHGEMLQWIRESTAAGKAWVCANDEQGGADVGVPPDAWTGSPTQHAVRQATLWGNLMAGGAGIESYFGYGTGETDLTLQDFRSRDRWWDYCRHALAFFDQHLPFAQMSGRDDLVGNAAGDNSRYCFAQPGETYAVYLPNGGSATLDLSGVSGTFEVRWFDPRNGGALQTGTVASVVGGGPVALGSGPSSTTWDWAVRVRRTGTAPPNQAPTAAAGPDQNLADADGDGTQPVTLDGAASRDVDGTIVSYVWNAGATRVATGVRPTASLPVGTHALTLVVTDDRGATASDVVTVVVRAAASGAVVYALNAGGGAYTAADGTAYAADGGASGGGTYATAATISGTADQALYRSERYGTFSYAIPLATGDYVVVLQFAEIYFSSPGQRVFDVRVEGALALDDLDLVARVGRNAAYDVRVPVRVADGALNLAFSAVVQNPKLSAFRIERAATPPPLTLTAIDASRDAAIAGLDPMADGAVIDLGAVGGSINLRANWSGAAAGSVRFAWTGATPGSRVENVAPYAAMGDANGDYAGWSPSPGGYSMTVTVYSGANASGTVLGARTFAFSIAYAAPATNG
ncbi:MAG TPA: malectin domain-containing carbohydrate-binding protein [Planctomycetota bacterium]|nr:malectin domain-containing carbohydrate-binding protein [Planctomycetota bacterium]